MAQSNSRQIKRGNTKVSVTATGEVVLLHKNHSSKNRTRQNGGGNKNTIAKQWV